MKKSILFICQRVPYPPDRGDRITTWNFIRHLAKTYAVHLFCLASEKGEEKKQDILSSVCQSVHIYYKPKWQCALDAGLALLTGRPLSNGYYYSRGMTKDITNLIQKEKISLAYAYSSNMFSHVVAHSERIPILYHYGDVDSEKWKKMAQCSRFPKSWLYQTEFKRLRKWELACTDKGVANVFSIAQEAKLFTSIGGRGRLVDIPNGVDYEYFSPSSTPEEKEDAFVFTGVMNYFPNVDTVLTFVKDVYPLIERKKKDIRFYIVGSQPTPEVIEIGKKNPRCVVTGYVQDVRQYMRKAKLFVAPMKVAQGMQNKIIEAMAIELPVVTYSHIAEPLQLGKDQGIIGVRSPQEMSDVILQLLENENERSMLGKAARKAVIEKYGWEAQLTKLSNLIENSIQQGSAKND